MVVQKMKEIASRLGLFILVSLILMGVVLLWGMDLSKRGKSTHDQKEYIYLATGYYIYKFDMDGNLIWKTGGKGSIGEVDVNPKTKKYEFMRGPDEKYGKFGEVSSEDSSLFWFWPPIGGIVVVDNLVLAIDVFNYRIQVFDKETGEFVRIFKSLEGPYTEEFFALLGKDVENGIWYGLSKRKERSYLNQVYKTNKLVLLC